LAARGLTIWTGTADDGGTRLDPKGKPLAWRLAMTDALVFYRYREDWARNNPATAMRRYPAGKSV